jgi:hypothetical protein
MPDGPESIKASWHQNEYIRSPVGMRNLCFPSWVLSLDYQFDAQLEELHYSGGEAIGLHDMGNIN